MALKLRFARTDVGKFVYVQVFDKHVARKGELVEGSLVVYVGELQAFIQSRKEITFKIKGLKEQTFLLEKQHLEVMLVDEIKFKE